MHLTVTAALLLLGGSLAQKIGKVSFYEFPGFLDGPCDIAYGVDKNIWVQDQFASKIGIVYTDTGKVKELPIPYKNPPNASAVIPSIDGRNVLACAIQPGADGLMYASAGTRNEFVIINPKTHKVKVVPSNNILGNLQPFNDLYRADDAMWFTQTSGNVITRFDYKTHKQKNFPIQTPESFPLGLYVTPDGAIWVAEFGLSKMLRLNGTTGKMQEFPCPLNLTQPAVIRAFKSPYLYFTATTSNAIGAININPPHDFKTFTNNLAITTPTVDIMDGHDRVWYSSLKDATLSILNIKTGVYKLFNTPSHNGSPPADLISVTYGKRQNSMFYTQEAGNFVGRIQLGRKKSG